MKKLPRVLSLLLIVAAVLSVVFVDFTNNMRVVPLDYGSVRPFSEQLVSTELVEDAVADARHAMLQSNERGVRLQSITNWLKWIAFAISAAVTLIAGYHGKSVSANGTDAINPNELEKLPRTMRLIGVLAALASCLALGMGYLREEADLRFQQSDKIRALIAQTYVDLEKATNASQANDILDRLRLETSR